MKGLALILACWTALCVLGAGFATGFSLIHAMGL